MPDLLVAPAPMAPRRVHQGWDLSHQWHLLHSLVLFQVLAAAPCPNAGGAWQAVQGWNSLPALALLRSWLSWIAVMLAQLGQMHCLPCVEVALVEALILLCAAGCPSADSLKHLLIAWHVPGKLLPAAILPCDI